ncbi:MAG: cytochrome c family protein, partial [Pirellulales bacterium]|nr:cytochrome c family protein [Pirellulales bacterium]
RSISDLTQQLSATMHRIEGPEKCLDCHRSEYLATARTHHATETFDMLHSGDSAKDSREIAEKLDIPVEAIASQSVCIHCHATPQVDQAGRVKVLPGVSCESCHGASGGDQGWLNRHAVYGPPRTTREMESPDHYQARLNHCLQAGQNRSADTFRMARACYECHLVWHEKLVNVGEHPSGSDSFEYVAWSLGEVRHNFHQDQGANALVSTLWKDPLWRPGGHQGKPVAHLRQMYVSGLLAKLYVGLRNRSLAAEEGDFASDMEVFIEDAQGELEGILEEYSDAQESGEEEETLSLSSIERAVEAAAGAMEEVGDIEDPWSEAGLAASARLFARAAQEVEAAAGAFVSRHDGENLQVVDDFAPEMEALVEQDPDVVVGKAWQPAADFPAEK